MLECYQLISALVFSITSTTAEYSDRSIKEHGVIAAIRKERLKMDNPI
jgi:hypothetical protein